MLGAQQLPAHLPAELADELPEGPGVYRFFGEGDALLYIGKSKQLRIRVLAHFAGEHRDAKEQKLARLTRRVDWRETAGELGALLLESQWIKQQRPLYNRRLKQSVSGCTLRLQPDTGAVEILDLSGLEPRQLEDCRGVFHAARDARRALTDIARDRQLCLKVIGLEPGAGGCFAQAIGRCKGACVGREPLALHTLRLGMALAPLKLKGWPFPGRIALRERAQRWGAAADEMGDESGAELHVLEHWAYLGTARSPQELQALRACPAPAGFDIDIYRILARYLGAHATPDWHDLRAVHP